MNKRKHMKMSFERQRLLNKVFATPGPMPFVLILDNLKVDFNIGKIIRSAEAFGAQAVDVVGTTFFNPLPAKGCMKRVPWSLKPNFSESYQAYAGQGYTFYAFDSEAEEAIHDVRFPDRSAFILGPEEFGFSFQKEHYPLIKWIRIPQLGQVQSLNVSIAASIAMYEFNRSRNFTRPAPSPEA